MKQLIVLLIAFLASCNNPKSSEQEEGKKTNETEHHLAVPLNNGAKWKADEATKKNVAAIVQVVNDSAYADAMNRKQFYSSLQTGIDTLINQCKMKGAEHDALHVWLEKLLDDVKEIKKEDEEYGEAYASLKRDVGSFYEFFE